MTSKEIPLAGAVQADQQGASNIYPQNTHFGPSGQAEEQFGNSAASQRQRENLQALTFAAPVSRVKHVMVMFGLRY